MPDPTVTEKDSGLLECGCKIEKALVEEIYMKLGIIGKDIVEGRKGEGSGWKALEKPEKERIMTVLNLLGLSIDSLFELIQD